MLLRTYDIWTRGMLGFLMISSNEYSERMSTRVVDAESLE